MSDLSEQPPRPPTPAPEPSPPQPAAPVAAAQPSEAPPQFIAPVVIEASAPVRPATPPEPKLSVEQFVREEVAALKAAGDENAAAMLPAWVDAAMTPAVGRFKPGQLVSRQEFLDGIERARAHVPARHGTDNRLRPPPAVTHQQLAIAAQTAAQHRQRKGR